MLEGAAKQLPQLHRCPFVQDILSLGPLPPRNTAVWRKPHISQAKFSQEPPENLYCALVFYAVGQHTQVHIGHHVVKNRCDFFTEMYVGHG